MQEIRKFNKIIVANWKLHGSFLFIKALIRDIKIGFSLQDNACIIICPPFPYIKDLKSDNFFKGAQDCSIYSRGAYTGEISSKILKDLECQFCILGHSERRNLFNEKNEIISKKATNCLKEKIIPILCIGETLEQKKNHQTKEVLENQIKKCIPIEANNKKLIIAYEPIWAIGTGLIPTFEEIAEIHNFIKNDIPGFENYKVIYGGSVKPSNSKDILAIKSVDGVLVGGASVNIEEFNIIIAS